MKNHIILYALMMLPALSGKGIIAQEILKVDFDKIIKKDINPGIGSANLCWLTDSDLNRPNPHNSMQTAISEMGMGSLRFPYGHLADNYLWHTPPYDDTANGLRPKVAAFSDAPYGWDWATNEDGSFKAGMDFDEYMQLCQKLNIKPLVVVNVFSFKYEGGPTYDELKTAAVEWVKYAKKKNYEVAYWQIGNEVDHHKKLLTMDQYIALYKEFATAMKAIDPTLQVGPGILSQTEYFDKIVSEMPELIDFTSCHQYAWPYIKSCPDYAAWKDYQSDFVPNVNKMQEAVSSSVKSTMDVVITETGLTPSGKGMGDESNTYKALWYFEMLMNEVSLPNVAYSYFWGTHSPWKGLQDTDRDLDILLRLDDNTRKPIAESVKLVNDHILTDMVETTKVSGYLRTYASKDNAGNINVFIMNRNDMPQDIVLKLEALPPDITNLEIKIVQGETPLSKKFELSSGKPVQIKNDEVMLSLPPLSITAFKN